MLTVLRGFHLFYLVEYQNFPGTDVSLFYLFQNGTSIVDLWFLFKQQGLSDIRRGGRRTRVVSANKPSPRPSKRNSEKKKYVEKESSKNVPRKTTADVSSSKPDYRQSNSSGKELPGNETAAIIDSSPPGIALTMDSGKKKILLLRSKDRDNPDNPPPQPEQHIDTNLSRNSTDSRQNQKSDVGGRLIKGILLRNDSRPSQSSTFVQSEQRVEPSEAENYKRPSRPANTRAGYKGIQFK
jgi:regulator of nonsense transcripts 3